MNCPSILTAPRRLSVALVVAFALTTAACGGGGTGQDTVVAPPAPRAPLTAAELLPASTFLVARVDLAALRTSPNWDIIDGWVLTAEENLAGDFPSLGGGELRSWLGLTDQIWVAFVPSTNAERPGIVTVVDGRFEAAAIEAKLAGLGGDRPILAPVPDQSGRFGGSWWFQEVGVIEDGLVVATSGDLLDTVVARHESREGESPLVSATLRDMARRVDFANNGIAAIAHFTPEAKALLGANLETDRRRAVDAATSGGLGLSLAGGIDAIVLLDTLSPEVAAALVSEVEQRRDSVRRNPIVAMMGLSPLLAGIDASATDGNAQVTVHTGAEDTRTVLGRLSSLIGLGIASAINDLPRPEPAVQESSATPAGGVAPEAP